MTHFTFGYVDTSVDPLAAVEYGVDAEKVGLVEFIDSKPY